MNDFLQMRHASFGMPEGTLYSMVRQATGQEPVRRERIVRGRDNEVHAVTTDRGEAFILRIRRHGKVGFGEEAWAIEQSRAHGAPVPEIVWVASVCEDDLNVQAMVQRRAPGRPLSALLPWLELQQLRSVYAQAGEALSRIHAVQVGGFYRLRSSGCWDFPNWEQVMQSHRRNRMAETRELAHCGFTPREIDRILALIERYASDFRCDRPVLCHGDFRPEHLLFTDDLRLSAVIDFGDFLGGPPVTDFASLKMSCPEVEVGWLLAGYGDPGEDRDRFAVRLLLHQIGMQVGYLAYELKEGNLGRAAELAEGLRTLLGELAARDEGKLG
jgi:aminoglycoside phosphotransferase (APT) family kinase protein